VGSTCVRKLLNLQCNRDFRERGDHRVEKNVAMNVTARMVKENQINCIFWNCEG